MKGYRTYIVASLVAVTTGLHAAGILDDTTFATIMGLLGAGGLATLRAAVQ